MKLLTIKDATVELRKALFHIIDDEVHMPVPIEEILQVDSDHAKYYRLCTLVFQAYFKLDVFTVQDFSPKLVSRLKRKLSMKTKGYSLRGLPLTKLDYNDTLTLFFACCLGTISAIEDTVKGKPAEVGVLRELEVFTSDLQKECVNYGVNGR